MPTVAHTTPQDGAIEATAGNTERMVCDVGYQFADESDYIDVTCAADALLWQGTLTECESKTSFIAEFVEEKKKIKYLSCEINIISCSVYVHVNQRFLTLT